VPWSQGGETRLGNLASLCRRHHRFVHELGFRIEADARGGFAFFHAHGWELTRACVPPPLGPSPIDELRARHSAAGLAIDARTGLPDWDGTRADYDHIVFCLMARHDRQTCDA
jgi:hypothetical protein